MKKILHTSILLLLVAFMTGCAQSVSPAASFTPQRIVFSQQNYDLVIGERHELDYSVQPENTLFFTPEYQSSNPGVVRIDGNAVVGISIGESVITVSYEGKVLGKCTVKVGHIEPERVWLDENIVYGKIGRLIDINVNSFPEKITDLVYSYTIEDDSIVKIQNGQLYGFGAGETNVTITHDTTGLSVSCLVCVSPVDVDSITIKCSDSVLIDRSIMLRAVFSPEDASDQTVSWQSSNPEIASVEDSYLYGHKEGVVIISAITPSGITAEKEIQIIPIQPESLTLECSDKDCMLIVGDKASITAVISPDDASNKTITWTSSDNNIATVNNKGIVKAIKPGTVTITAELVNGISRSISFTINPKPVSVSNGFIKKPTGSRVAPVTIHASKDASSYVYFKHKTDSKKDFSIFVKAGTTVNVKAPLGLYEMYYASGNTWYGKKIQVWCWNRLL